MMSPEREWEGGWFKHLQFWVILRRLTGVTREGESKVQKIGVTAFMDDPNIKIGCHILL